MAALRFRFCPPNVNCARLANAQPEWRRTALFSARWNISIILTFTGFIRSYSAGKRYGLFDLRPLLLTLALKISQSMHPLTEPESAVPI
jgi:hypothetical protein